MCVQDYVCVHKYRQYGQRFVTCATNCKGSVEDRRGKVGTMGTQRAKQETHKNSPSSCAHVAINDKLWNSTMVSSIAI